MRRILALDIGTARTGVAVSDPLGMFAQGLAVIKQTDKWLAELSKIIDEHDNPLLLVGKPRLQDGSYSPMSEVIESAVAAIREKYPDIEIRFWDEWFTTVIAERTLIEADVSRAGRKKKVDKLAATLILQNYLDTERNRH